MILKPTDALPFLERAFRNIDLPPLSRDDLRDIADALDAFAASRHSDPDELREALEPFAAEADEWGDGYSDDYWPFGAGSNITMGDLRKARTALSRNQGDAP